MIKTVKTETRKGVFVDLLEYTLCAFKTEKGTFTLSGTFKDGDEYKHLETLTFHRWNRSQIKEWLDKGLISPIGESNSLDWHEKKVK